MTYENFVDEDDDDNIDASSCDHQALNMFTFVRFKESQNQNVQQKY